MACAAVQVNPNLADISIKLKEGKEKDFKDFENRKATLEELGIMNGMEVHVVSNLRLEHNPDETLEDMEMEEEESSPYTREPYPKDEEEEDEDEEMIEHSYMTRNAKRGTPGVCGLSNLVWRLGDFFFFFGCLLIFCVYFRGIRVS